MKNNGGTRFAGLATKMDRYCGRMALGIELMKYGCGESNLEEISEDSMRCSIALCYYFLACGLKAQKRFMNSPTEDFTQIQREVYDELPQSFETKRGLEIQNWNEKKEITFDELVKAVRVTTEASRVRGKTLSDELRIAEIQLVEKSATVSREFQNTEIQAIQKSASVMHQFNKRLRRIRK